MTTRRWRPEVSGRTSNWKIAAVIGTAGQDLSVEEAEQAIVGYMIFNDWSARDLQQLEGQLAIGQAKGKDSGVTLGPYLVTPDELEPHRRDGRAEPRRDRAGQRRGDRIRVDRPDGLELRRSHLLRIARRRTHPRATFSAQARCRPARLVEHLDSTAPESFRGWLHDGDIVTLRVEGLGETRQTGTENRCTATTVAATEPRRHACGATGQPGAGENPVHPRVTRGRRTGVGLDVAGRWIRLE